MLSTTLQCYDHHLPLLLMKKLRIGEIKKFSKVTILVSYETEIQS